MFAQKPSSPTQIKGLYFEKLALNYLKKQGLKFLQNNYHCRLGEIDLVMKDRSCIVFIEVRYRANTGFGHAFETVNKPKQQKTHKSRSILPCTRRTLRKVPMRFDVIKHFRQ